MKHILLSLFILVAINAAAQNADQRVGELINEGDWFALAEEYPRLKDSMQVEFLQPMAEALLAKYFNQSDKAIAAMTTLLSNYQEEIGASSALNFALLRLQMIGEQGNYAEAADGLKSIAEQLPQVPTIQRMYQHYNALRDYPQMTIYKPNKDDTIPFHLQRLKANKREEWMRAGKKQFKGYLMSVPVTCHGEQQSFIFDTGASASFVTESVAKNLNLTILSDTVMLNGNQKGLQAYIDSLQIGDIVCRNMIVYVGLKNPLDSLVSGVDAVLGMDFIKAVGETQILFDRQQIVFPSQPTTSTLQSNIFLDGTLLMQARKGDVPLSFTFDTGCTTAELYSDYYAKFTTEVDAVAEPDTITTGTYGTVTTSPILLLPELTCMIGETSVTIDEINLFPSNNNPLAVRDGRMGMELIRRFRKTTINLNAMFVKFE